MSPDDVSVLLSDLRSVDPNVPVIMMQGDDE